MDTGDLTIDADTTGRDLIAVLTEGEVSCIRNALTEDAYTRSSTSRLSISMTRQSSRVNVSVPNRTRRRRHESGGLSAGSTSCLRDLR